MSDPIDRHHSPAAQLAAWLEYRGLPPDATLRELIQHERDNAALAAGFDAVNEIRAARAAGYAQAVEALRDDERYVNHLDEDMTGYVAIADRRHLADYLATVGPVVVGGQPEQKETGRES